MSDSRVADGRLSRVWVAIGAAVVAAILLCASGWADEFLWPDSPAPGVWLWWENLLVNLGAAAALVVPLEWVAYRLRRQVSAAEERQAEAVTRVREDSRASTTELRQHLDALNTRVSSLAELSEVVERRTTEQARADVDLFASLKTEVPTPDSVARALTRARERKLCARRVRVPVARYGRLRLGFEVRKGVLVLRLETLGGKVLQEWVWTETTAATDVFPQVAVALDSEGEPAPLDVQFVFERLAETLTVAADHSIARPIIEWFPGQWALSETAISSIEPPYDVSHDAPNRGQLDVQVKSKGWLDYDSYDMAHWVASEMFPMSTAQRAFEAARLLQDYGVGVQPSWGRHEPTASRKDAEGGDDEGP